MHRRAKASIGSAANVRRDGYRFSSIAGTIFENTNKPLRDWFKVTHLMLTSKKGISALQIQRHMGFGSYKTAWYMCHKIRAALIETGNRKLGGIVEVDETFIGGKDSNKHWDKRGVMAASWPAGKTPSSARSSARATWLPAFSQACNSTTLQCVRPRSRFDKVSLLATDE